MRMAYPCAVCSHTDDAVGYVMPCCVGCVRLCTKSLVRNLTHGSMRTFWSHSEDFSRPDSPILSVKIPPRNDFWCKAAASLREPRVHPGSRREGEEGHAVCQTLLGRCGHAPMVLEPKRHRHGPVRSASKSGEACLVQCRAPGAGHHAPRALSDACRPMAASASGQRVCVPRHHL
jgi:hypothetical protein